MRQTRHAYVQSLPHHPHTETPDLVVLGTRWARSETPDLVFGSTTRVPPLAAPPNRGLGTPNRGSGAPPGPRLRGAQRGYPLSAPLNRGPGHGSGVGVPRSGSIPPVGEMCICTNTVARARRGSRRENGPFWTTFGEVLDPQNGGPEHGVSGT